MPPQSERPFLTLHPEPSQSMTQSTIHPTGDQDTCMTHHTTADTHTTPPTPDTAHTQDTTTGEVCEASIEGEPGTCPHAVPHMFNSKYLCINFIFDREQLGR